MFGWAHPSLDGYLLLFLGIFRPKDCNGFPVQKTAGNHRKFGSTVVAAVVIACSCCSMPCVHKVLIDISITLATFITLANVVLQGALLFQDEIFPFNLKGVRR